MSVGRRLQRFMTKHHLTFRDIERMTGVGKATLSRIINGYTGPTLEYQINRIVAGLTENGYRVTREELLEGLEPRADFEWTVRQAAPEQRLAYLMMTLQERLRLTLNFLRTRYPAKCRADLLAAVCQLEIKTINGLFADWNSLHPDRSMTLKVATGISRLLDITMHWFMTGWLDEEDPTEEIVCGFEELLHDATTTTLVIRNVRRVLKDTLGASHTGHTGGIAN